MSMRRLGASVVINSFVRIAANRTPGIVKRSAGGSLGPADAEFLQDNDAAKDWLLSFMQVTCTPSRGQSIHPWLHTWCRSLFVSLCSGLTLAA
jgi:hypothetical protein